LVTVASIAVAVLAAVLLTALAASYARAIRAPVETVGADVVVQITGDIPPKLEGLVFPHPNALVPGDATTAIVKMPGVISVTRGVYMWELAPDRYQSVLGIDEARPVSARSAPA
jgi:putative ABC transport system permease protein